MRQKSRPEQVPAEAVVKDIRRVTRRQFRRKRRSASCWKAFVARRALPNSADAREWPRRCTIYYGWSKECLEAGKRRLAGDRTARRPRMGMRYPASENTGIIGSRRRMCQCAGP